MIKNGDRLMTQYIFDFDGVLVDSMPVWAGTYVQLLEQHGIPVPDGFVRRITPLGNDGAAQCLIEAGLPLSKEEIRRCAMERYAYEYSHNISLKPHVAQTLERLVANGNKVHVLTGSSHCYVDPCLKRHNVFHLFENVWSVDDFPYTKAQPEIYREVAERLCVPLSECVFFDDNYPAIKTAAAAGMPTVGVYDVSSADFVEQMKAVADRYITDFAEI